MKYVIEEFKSLSQLANTLNERKLNEVFEGETRSSMENSFSFTKTNSYQEAENLMLTGYDEIIKEISMGVYEKGANVKDLYNRRRTTTGVVGYAPHVPNAILGLPNSMIYTKNEPVKVKTLDICYCCTDNCRTDSDNFIRAGKTILSIVNTLEMKGIRVKLRACFYCAKDDREDEEAFATVMLKDYREQLDLLKMCFPLAHPSMLRRIGFAWLETVPDLTGRWTGSYGHQIDLNDNDKKKVLKKDEIYISLRGVMRLNYDKDRVIDKFFDKNAIR